MVAKEQKTAILSVRIKPSIKAMAERLANADGRSLASFLEVSLRPPTLEPNRLQLRITSAGAASGRLILRASLHRCLLRPARLRT
jgi:hypothetical protein